MTNQEGCDEAVKLINSRPLEFANLASVVIFIDRFTGAAAFNTDIEQNDVLAAAEKAAAVLAERVRVNGWWAWESRRPASVENTERRAAGIRSGEAAPK